MKLETALGIKHHYYPSITFRCGFIKPPQEWALYAEGTLLKLRWAIALRNKV